MAVDPMIARGVTPLGEGLVQTLMLAKQAQMEQQRADDFSARTQLDQRQFEAGQVSAAQLAELREKYAEMIGYEGAPPEVKAQYVAIQAQKHPNFAQTPFASMPPEQAFAAMLNALRARLGENAPKAQNAGLGNVNPGDYTPESMAAYARSINPQTGYGDFGALQRQYAPPQPVMLNTPAFGAALVDRRTGQPIAQFTTSEQEIAAGAAAKRAESQASAAGQAEAEETTQTADREAAWRLYETAMAGLRSGLEGSVTGPVSGRIPAVTSAQQTAEGGVAAMAPVLKQLFRVAGEGVFTDRDQQLLLDMVPKRTDTPAARDAKIANIDAIVRAKLRMPAATDGPKAGEVVKGYRFKGGDPSKRENWEKAP